MIPITRYCSRNTAVFLSKDLGYIDNHARKPHHIGNTAREWWLVRQKGESGETMVHLFKLFTSFGLAISKAYNEMSSPTLIAIT